jgi:hypothetical protein
MKKAKELRSIYYGNGEVVKEVDNILEYITTRIEYALTEKKNKVKVELPTVFDIGSMTNKTASIYVYSTLIKKLEKNGYEVRIKYVEGQSRDERVRVFLYVSWINESDKKYKNRMLKEIQKHLYEPTSE